MRVPGGFFIDRDPEYAFRRPPPPVWSTSRFCVWCPAAAPGPDNVFTHTGRCRMNPANYRRHRGGGV